MNLKSIVAGNTMQLTRFSDYAMRVLMYTHAANGRLVTIEEMASNYRISRAHLMKVVNTLTRARYLTAVRGRTGGVTLARPADKINLGAVIRDTEPDFALVECFSCKEACIVGGCCKLPAVLRRAMAAFLAELDRHTLASIAIKPKDFIAVFPEAIRG
ncbi:MAG: RrF2 family transcriptional regulator [Hyphomicrobiaceae bacterium]